MLVGLWFVLLTGRWIVDWLSGALLVGWLVDFWFLGGCVVVLCSW